MTDVDLDRWQPGWTKIDDDEAELAAEIESFDSAASRKAWETRRRNGTAAAGTTVTKSPSGTHTIIRGQGQAGVDAAMAYRNSALAEAQSPEATQMQADAHRQLSLHASDDDLIYHDNYVGSGYFDENQALTSGSATGSLDGVFDTPQAVSGPRPKMMIRGVSTLGRMREQDYNVGEEFVEPKYGSWTTHAKTAADFSGTGPHARGRVSMRLINADKPRSIAGLIEEDEFIVDRNTRFKIVGIVDHVVTDSPVGQYQIKPTGPVVYRVIDVEAIGDADGEFSMQFGFESVPRDAQGQWTKAGSMAPTPTHMGSKAFAPKKPPAGMTPGKKAAYTKNQKAGAAIIAERGLVLGATVDDGTSTAVITGYGSTENGKVKVRYLGTHKVSGQQKSANAFVDAPVFGKATITSPNGTPHIPAGQAAVAPVPKGKPFADIPPGTPLAKDQWDTAKVGDHVISSQSGPHTITYSSPDADGKSTVLQLKSDVTGEGFVTDSADLDTKAAYWSKGNTPKPYTTGDPIPAGHTVIYETNSGKLVSATAVGSGGGSVQVITSSGESKWAPKAKISSTIAPVTPEPPDFGAMSPEAKKAYITHQLTKSPTVPTVPSSPSTSMISTPSGGAVAKPANWSSMTPGKKAAWTKKHGGAGVKSSKKSAGGSFVSKAPSGAGHTIINGTGSEGVNRYERQRDKLYEQSIPSSSMQTLNNRYSEFSTDEKSTLSLYTGSGYKEINAQLRGKSAPIPTITNRIARIDKLFADHGDKAHPAVMVRGVNNKGSRREWQYKVGEEFVEPKYGSWTVTPHTAKASIFGGSGSAKRGRAFLRVTNANKGRAIAGSTSEGEFIMDRNTKYRVVAITDHIVDGAQYRYMDVEIIP